MVLRVDRRFRGPSDSGNGGYVCGLMAARVGATVGGFAAEVTLRSPPPLETAMSVVTDNPGMVRLSNGDVTVAEGARSPLTVDAVPPVDRSSARTASASYPGLLRHPFPECFVCGPDRAVDDGLRLFPGRLGDGRTACTWTVSADLAGRPEFVWAVLDCPGGWSADMEGRPMVLGRMTARLTTLPGVEEECVVVGLLLRSEGRKTWTATTAYGADGRELGRARSTWLTVNGRRSGRNRGT
jgi:hypothetical protein